ncbi:phosphatidylinositol-3,5-bisphosphate 5-phosphatase [Ascosphaera atra]|nr:phosphatidylinositol-3,5-bisphosphate 5-phosphatase [Ascosphaera atra]
MLGGHFVYQIDGTELIPLSPSVSGKTRTEKVADEARFLAIINNLDLTRSFYFSYSYDITRTLQFNITKAREAVQRGDPGTTPFSNVNSMFEWNHYLLQPVVPSLKNPYDWCFPIVHGYVDQANISVFGRPVYVTVIARRSRYFAGARFLKRGANDLGYVANDVETEQIVSDTLTTSFHAPGPRLYANPRYTSYVQHRGSIPLYWSQDSTGVAPKPDIEMNLVDPFYSAAALHFDNLFERYGTPVYVLNLVKAREREPRESKLLREYTDAVMYLNQFLPEDKRIVYKAFDMSRAAKSRDQDVILSLEEIAEDIIPRTGLFKAGEGEGADGDGDAMLQNGVARTNCIDCLDRTNAAQFVIGKRALGHQLHALGIIDTTSIEYDTDAINMFTNMWHHHGDTIAVQYGGSQLVNTMATYRKTNQWTGQSRDMVESFKRYYNNSFLDAQRQEAYNLFLGNYVYTPDEPMLWDLSTDYYLHHSNPKQFLCFKRRSYINWYTPEFLEKRTMPGAVTPPERKIKRKEPTRRGNTVSDTKSKRGQLEDDGDIIGQYDDYFTEYYRPLGLSLFQKTYAFKMKSTARYLPYGHGAVAASPAPNAASSGRSPASGHAHTNSSSSHHAMYDMSPFTPRVASPIHEAYVKKHSRRKGVTIKDPRDVRHGDTTRTSSPAASAATNAADDTRSVSSSMSEFSTTHKPLQQWLQTIPSSSTRDDHRSPNGLKGIIKPRLPGRHSSPLVSFAPDTYAPTSTSTTPRLPPPDHYHDHDHDADYDADPSATTTTTTAATATTNATATPSRSSSRTLEDVVNQTLHPTVSKAEADEYNRYVNHPLTMPLVGSISDTEDRDRSAATETRSAAQRELDSRADADLLEYADKRLVDELIMDITAEYNLVTYAEYVRVQPEEGLAVLKNDHLQKRYRLYESWTKGRSVLKQRVDG